MLASPRSVSAENRSIDGSGNNLASPTWGQANSAFIREASGNHYADGIFAPAGGTRPSARVISNTVHAQGASTFPDPRGLTSMTYTWGQFIDHDLDLRTNILPLETSEFFIPVPLGDPWFDPFNTGNRVIEMWRSVCVPNTGPSTGNPCEQMNKITSWLDASMVYGSDPARAAWLRTGVGGRLKTTAHTFGPLLPFNDGTQTMDGISGPSQSTTLFVAGDNRANEQVGLTSMHTVFSREHNRLADLLAQQNPTWTDEEVYQRARKIVAAEVQVITFQEFLPTVLGFGALPAYQGYDPSVNPSIRNAFAAAGYRVGHTMLDPILERYDANGDVISAGHLSLRNAFFKPSEITTTSRQGIAPILRGLVRGLQESVDVYIIDDVRNFLFGMPGFGGLDLASLNIQRGRDHGLADYNTMRQDFGLAPVNSFAEITSDPTIQANLQAAYGDVSNIDAWTGALAEDHLPNAAVGPLISAILIEQFTSLRAADRFWYANDPALTPQEIAQLEATTLADIIMRNTEITGLRRNVFRTRSDLPGDIDIDGDVDRTDAAQFAMHFGKASGADWSTGDFDGDGATTLMDWGLLQSRMGQSLNSPAPHVAVPEPAGGILAAVLLGALAGARARVPAARRGRRAATAPAR